MREVHLLKSDAMKERDDAMIVVSNASSTLGRKRPVIIAHLYFRAALFSSGVSWCPGTSVELVATPSISEVIPALPL